MEPPRTAGIRATVQQRLSSRNYARERPCVPALALSFRQKADAGGNPGAPLHAASSPKNRKTKADADACLSEQKRSTSGTADAQPFALPDVMEDHEDRPRDEPRDRLNYLREELKKLRERIEREAERERRRANLPFHGPDRRHAA